MTDYQKTLQFICSKMRAAYKKTSEKTPVFYDKGNFDEVSSLDFSIESYLIDQIKRYDPAGHILSEELHSTTILHDRTWIIDPIDGTCNLTHGIRMFGMQCALFENNEIVLSAIYFPEADEMFSAIAGQGAYLNGHIISPSHRSADHAIISFGDFQHNDPQLSALELKIMSWVSPRVEKVRMFGSASIDLAYVACGRIEGNFTFVRNLWDIMPGLLLCREAGALITDECGNTYHAGTSSLAVFASKEIMDICIGSF